MASGNAISVISQRLKGMFVTVLFEVFHDVERLFFRPSRTPFGFRFGGQIPFDPFGVFMPGERDAQVPSELVPADE